MFVNISNHPSSRWSAEQRAAAGGPIVDIPFPNVPPTASGDEVHTLARRLLDTLPNGSTFMVQGEASLTFYLTRALLVRDKQVVVATTEREVQETVRADGSTSKEVTFRFVRFRDVY